MRFYRFGVVLLLLSNLYLPTVAIAQGELKTPDCSNPQEPMERMCCEAQSPESCKIFGYKAPEDTPASSIPPLNEIALVAPLEVAIGIPLSDLLGNLKARGLRRRGACEWHTKSQDVSATINVSLVSAAGTEAPNCDKDFPVHTINFQQNERRKEVFAKLPLPADMKAAWIKQFGDPASECRSSSPLPGSSQVKCEFKNVGAEIADLTVTYVRRESPIEGTARLEVWIVGSDQNDPAESAVGEDAGASSEDTRSAKAVLESELRKPMGKFLHCQSLRMTMKAGGDYIIEGVTIVDKGQLLTDMPEACKN